MKKTKIVVAAGGSSGSIYAKVLLDTLVLIQDQFELVNMVFTDNARYNWKLELQNDEYLKYPFRIFEKNDFMAPFASGSAGFDTMIICPCSMGLVGRIHAGVSDDLITRAADVMLKERKKLILVPRETPFSLIHLRNMTALTEAGAIICPAIPSFYSNPGSAESIAKTVTDRVLTLAGLNPPEMYKWNMD
jgi:4-hydroxy-3-polyprenylbenzoate decarboxylase